MVGHLIVSFLGTFLGLIGGYHAINYLEIKRENKKRK